MQKLYFVLAQIVINTNYNGYKRYLHTSLLSDEGMFYQILYFVFMVLIFAVIWKCYQQMLIKYLSVWVPGIFEKTESKIHCEEKQATQ